MDAEPSNIKAFGFIWLNRTTNNHLKPEILIHLTFGSFDSLEIPTGLITLGKFVLTL